MDSSILSTLTSLISIICPLVIFVACSYYLSKKVNIDSILLFIGSCSGLLLTGFYSVLMPFLMQNKNFAFADWKIYYTIGGIVGFIFGLCFAVGLFILVNKTVNANKKVSHQFLPSNDEL